MSDPFDIPADAPYDPILVKDMETQLTSLTEDIQKHKMEEAALFQASVADGGPGSLGEAVKILMRDRHIGVRQLAVRADVKRKKLQMMLDGSISFDQTYYRKITDVLEQIEPI